jgi:hypothetical protein
LPRRIALNRDRNALAVPLGEENCGLRPDITYLPTGGDPRLSGGLQNRPLIGARWQLGKFNQPATHVPHRKVGDTVSRLKRIGFRSPCVVLVAHSAN